MKRTLDDSISSSKRFHSDITCLFDLPNEILLMICRYLPIYDIFHCFYTPENPDYRLHGLITDYYTKLSIGGIKFDEFNYLMKLFANSNNSLRPFSLKLSNSNVSYLIARFFKLLSKNNTELLLQNLINLTLLECTSKDLYFIDLSEQHLTKLEYLHLTIRDADEYQRFYFEEKVDIYINQLLFNHRLTTLHHIHFQSPDGLSLYRSLIPHQNLRYVHIHLRTIDDLYLLLNGLIPNVQILIVHLKQKRLLKCDPNMSKFVCSKLIDFTLLDNSTGVILDQIELILNLMTNLNKLTLSIRDTLDPLFSHGPNFESILKKSLPNLRQFNYTMTHQVTEKTIIEEFVRWPMNIVKDENNPWIHIYSLPWPSSKDDQRDLPLINGKPTIPMTSDIQIRRSSQLQIDSFIETPFPSKITKLILQKETPIGSINSIQQNSIRHLIVKCRLTDVNDLSILNHQYPNVKYLELLFPLDEKKFLCCFQKLFQFDDENHQRCYWNELIHFRTIYSYEQGTFLNDQQFHYWLIANTDLKFHRKSFGVNSFQSILSIWF